MESKTKTETFIGFAVRAGKFRVGTNAVQTLKKAFLVIVCKTASQNTKKQALKIANKFRCPIMETVSKTLTQFVYKDNAKVMAITDFGLSKAILDALSENELQSLIENISKSENN